MAAFKIDRLSETWAAIVSDVKKQIADLRDDLERSLDPAATENVRGKIAAYRAILAMGAPVAQTEPTIDTGGYGIAGPEH